MSKIKELLHQNDNILVFDMDGVLAVMEWGEYNHFDDTDDEWIKTHNHHTGSNIYTEQYVSKRMQDYLKDKNKNNVFVISKAFTEVERESKIIFAYKYYGIPKENCFFVEDNDKKASVLNDIIKKYPEVPKYKIVMVEDTTAILNDIKEKVGCSTVHISSFLDL